MVEGAEGARGVPMAGGPESPDPAERAAQQEAAAAAAALDLLLPSCARAAGSLLGDAVRLPILQGNRNEFSNS